MELRDYQVDGLNEIRASFAKGIRRVCYVAPCGAGKGTMVAAMANGAADKNNRVLFLIHRRELLEQVHEDIGRAHPLIQLKTVQSCRDVVEPRLIISDEFHHGTAATWRRIFDRFPRANVVGLTATPARMGGQGLAEICDRLIIGPSATELIKNGYLAPYKYYAPPMQVDFSEVRMVAGDFDQREITIRIDKPHITGKAIEHYLTLAKGKQAIIYCASLEHSRNTVEAFRAAGINARHIDGETPAPSRKQAVEDFKAGRLTVMSNVELFGEGLNLPGVEVVILLRPTQSLTLNLQQSMRSMRPGAGKTAIIIDAVGNVFRHGLPSQDREWTLTGTVKKRTTPGIGIRTCPQCFGCYAPAPACPYCGTVKNMTPRTLAEEQGTLKEFDAAEAEAAARKARMEVGRCKTIKELQEIAKARNYAPGWVWNTARAKGIKH